jgi:hypothetical protein
MEENTLSKQIWGVIKPGAVADLIVLAANPFKATGKEIKSPTIKKAFSDNRTGLLYNGFFNLIIRNVPLNAAGSFSSVLKFV